MARSAELSTFYRFFVMYEVFMVNVLGFITLMFQCELQDMGQEYHAKHPEMDAFAINSMFGHFWLQSDLNCRTREAQCLSYMVVGWLFIAGVLQVFIHFDCFRRLVFPLDTGDGSLAIA